MTIYPGLRTLLEADPDFLKNLGPFELDDLAFDFYVAAASTPLTSAQYIDFQTTEALKLRDAILADSEADVEGTHANAGGCIHESEAKDISNVLVFNTRNGYRKAGAQALEPFVHIANKVGIHVEEIGHAATRLPYRRRRAA